MNKIVRVYPNTDLRSGHRRLSMLANRKYELLANGHFLLFINRSQTMFKLLTANVVLHYRSPRGRIELRAIEHIPECFNGGKFNFDRAIDKALTKALKPASS